MTATAAGQLALPEAVLCISLLPRPFSQHQDLVVHGLAALQRLAGAEPADSRDMIDVDCLTFGHPEAVHFA